MIRKSRKPPFKASRKAQFNKASARSSRCCEALTAASERMPPRHCKRSAGGQKDPKKNFGSGPRTESFPEQPRLVPKPFPLLQWCLARDLTACLLEQSRD